MQGITLRRYNFFGRILIRQGNKVLVELVSILFHRFLRGSVRGDTMEETALFYQLFAFFHFRIPCFPCLIMDLLVLLVAVAFFVRIMVTFDIFDFRCGMAITVTLMICIAFYIGMGCRAGEKTRVFSHALFILCETTLKNILSLHQASAISSTGQWSEPYTSVWIPADCSFASRHLEVIK